MMFRGLNAVRLDAKGRMAMPSRYRERLQTESEGKVVVTIDTDSACLLLYPLGEWERIEARLAALPSFNPAARRIQRLLIGHATELEFDGNGRILIPPLLRDYASLEKQVMVVGQGHKFELWSDRQWEEGRETWLSAAGEQSLPDDLQDLAL